MSASYPTPEWVGPNERDDEVEETYDRGLAPREAATCPFSHGAGEAAGYRPLCAHGMSSLADRAYDLALGRLRHG